jgi:hypothetical protein
MVLRVWRALRPTSVVEAVSGTFSLLGAARLPTGAEAAADKGCAAWIATFIVVVAAAQAAKSRPAVTVRAPAADVVLGLVR